MRAPEFQKLESPLVPRCMTLISSPDIASFNLTYCLFVGVKNDPELKGVIPNSFEHIFSHIARTENQQYLVRASYLEIYMVGFFVLHCDLSD